MIKNNQTDTTMTKNISSAEIKIRPGSQIDIKIERAPKNTKVSDLEKRIKKLEDGGLDYTIVDQKIAEHLSKMDIVEKSYFLTALEAYSTTQEMNAALEQIVANEREWNDSRYLQKCYVTQEQYDTMSDAEKKENTISVIR